MKVWASIFYNVRRIFYVVLVAFILWFCLSVLEIGIKNNTAEKDYHPYNIFMILENVIEND